MSDTVHINGEFEVIAVTLDRIEKFLKENPNLEKEIIIHKDGNIDCESNEYRVLEITTSDCILVPILIKICYKQEVDVSYEWCKIDQQKSISNLYNFETEFYNGGTYLEEMLESRISCIFTQFGNPTWQDIENYLKEDIKLKRNLEPCNATNLMDYLDKNRSEGKMCLSNGECIQIDKAFKEGDWNTIIKYIHKYEKKEED